MLAALASAESPTLRPRFARWKHHDVEKPNGYFGRQALPIIWDFAETVFYAATQLAITQCD